MIRIHGVYSKDLKNRSSKDLYILTKRVAGKPAERSMSNAILAELQKSDKSGLIAKEINRRAKGRKTPRPGSKKTVKTENN